MCALVVGWSCYDGGGGVSPQTSSTGTMPLTTLLTLLTRLTNATNTTNTTPHTYQTSPTSPPRSSLTPRISHLPLSHPSLDHRSPPPSHHLHRAPPYPLPRALPPFTSSSFTPLAHSQRCLGAKVALSSSVYIVEHPPCPSWQPRSAQTYAKTYSRRGGNRRGGAVQ